jgi:hypothetical protein
MLTHYEAIRKPLTTEPWSVEQITQMCTDIGGVLAEIKTTHVLKLESYFALWRHDTTTGHIWIMPQVSGHNMIKVSIFARRRAPIS